MNQVADLSVIEESIKKALQKAIELREEKSRGKYQNVLQSAVQYMEENFSDENMTLNTVACVANVSANHFSAMFSQKMGQTFIEYLTGLRMNKAKELLETTNMKISQIAKEVGFSNNSYFCRSFREFFGDTPEACRKGTEADEKTNTEAAPSI